jgi:hypothetical protein
MARHIPFRIVGHCIDCGGTVEHRATGTLRCNACESAMGALRSAAVRAVRNAIAAGQLQAASECLCSDCEAPAAGYDHRDYLQPLNVAPVCRTCNQRRGPANWQRASHQGAPR